MTVTVTCWLCRDPLHRVADTRADEFVWVDEAGSQYGQDADLRGLGTPERPDAGPDARLGWLRGQLGRGDAERKRKAEHTWLYWAYAGEYSALKVRLDMSGPFHVHQARTSDLAAYDGPPVPEHCGWPMRLAPSGWRCRQCEHKEEK